MEANYPYDIKNQRGASKIPLVGGILRSKAPSRGLWMPELVLYGIRLLAKQLLGTVLDIEVDQSGLQAVLDQEGGGWRPVTFDPECRHQESRLTDFCHTQIQRHQGCRHSQAGSQCLHSLRITTNCP